MFILKFDSIGLAAQLFQVSLRTFREDYIKGNKLKMVLFIAI